MLVTASALDALFNAFKVTFNLAFQGAESQWGDVAMQVPSTTGQETYAWLGQSPRLREWLGDRILKSVSAYGYTIINRKFESTVQVPRTFIEDDSYGVFQPLVADLGRAAKEHPDELIFSMLGAGTTTVCYDGQYFFDSEHLSYDVDGNAIAASNIQAPASGDQAGPSWYLLDTSRPVRPFIFQERIKPEFKALVQEGDPNVFFRDEYVYGIRARHNVGFGLWQMAQMSTAPLTGSYYGQLRTALTTLRGDQGRLLGLKGTTLVVPPALEEAGRTLLNSALINASTNPWAGSAKLIISPWLAG